MTDYVDRTLLSEVYVTKLDEIGLALEALVVSMGVN